MKPIPPIPPPIEPKPKLLVEDVWWRMVKGLDPLELEGLKAALHHREGQFNDQKFAGKVVKPPQSLFPFSRLLSGVTRDDIGALWRAIDRAFDEIDVSKMPKPKWNSHSQIQCIKQYRETHQCGLKTAKTVVDHWWFENPLAQTSTTQGE